MPEIINITRDEAGNVLAGIPPNGFRFAKVDDFHTNGVRKDQVQVYILQWGKVSKLVEYWFCSQTPRNWLQWLLNNDRVFIKTGKRSGEKNILSYFIIPTDDYININFNERGLKRSLK